MKVEIVNKHENLENYYKQFLKSKIKYQVFIKPELENDIK